MLGSIRIIYNVNEVRRSARLRDGNIVNAVYAKRNQKAEFKQYKGVRKALLIKKVSWSMSAT